MTCVCLSDDEKCLWTQDTHKCDYLAFYIVDHGQHTLWSVGQPAIFVNKVLLEPSHVYVLFMAALELQWQSWVVEHRPYDLQA